jgi:Family of unknown function (DUF6282)
MILRLGSLTIVLIGGLWLAAATLASQGVTGIDRARLLEGAIDVHVHSYPDDRPRSIDAIEVAKLAQARKLRAIVLKNHYDSTAGLAFLVRKVVPDIEVFGGVALNLTVGGINPAAVEHMAAVSGGWGRIVWMPTFDAENQVRFSKDKRPFVPVAKNGKLVPEVAQVIAVAVKYKLMLETGHSSPAEALMIIREANRQGLEHVVVTHAMLAPVSMTIAQMQEAAKAGAFLEFVYNGLTGREKSFEFKDYAAAIRAVGARSCILSSDMGQAANPLHPDGLTAFFTGLLKEGIPQADIELMSRTNPARALGLQ